MGWWPFGGGHSADPVDKLDPKLREFLEKESPVKFQQQQQHPTTAKGSSSSSPATTATTTISHHTPDTEAEADRPKVPEASLYQDGRYAHLWKNYRPQAQIEADSLTDHERLMGVLEGYQDRKTAIARVAMENCAEPQEAWINCMKHGEWKDQVQMCRHQVRKFEQCYQMQSRFLRALGYGSVTGRPAQVEEDIQMHADALYQRVLQHEKAIEQARIDGKPLPKFDPAIPKAVKVTVQPSDEVQEMWRAHLDRLPEAERAIEEAALRADLQAKSEVARGMREILDARKKDDKETKVSAGQGTVVDTLTSWLRGGK